MVEENAQEKEPKEQDTNEQEPREKVSPVRKISLAFADIYGLVKKPKKTDDIPAPVGDSKQDSEGKKSAMILPLALSTQKINLKTVNQVLVFVLIGLLAAMFYVTFRKGPSISSVTAAVAKIKFLNFETKEITTFGKVTDYLEQIKKRDIFSEYEEEKPPPVVVVVEEKLPPPPPLIPKIPIEEKAKNLKLIGISWGKNPKAMIKDTTTQEVQFMSEGDTIKDTDLMIKKVLKEEVIITSEGEEMSML